MSSGPRVVALGGGTGLAVSLRAIRTYAGETTAVVTVADEGGSSGRLRQRGPGDGFAPGDVRRAIGALADPRSELGGQLNHRFAGGELDGHTLGNLILVGLAESSGDFQAAIDEAARLVGASGRVLSATAEPVRLWGRSSTSEVLGELNVAALRDLREIGLEPAEPAVDPAVLEAILRADQVVLGPGSLFTSVLATAAVPEIRNALHRTDATRVVVANLVPQETETAGFDVADQLEAIERHDIPFDVVLCPPELAPSTFRADVRTRLVSAADRRAHDTSRLAGALAEFSGRRGAEREVVGRRP